MYLKIKDSHLINLNELREIKIIGSVSDSSITIRAYFRDYSYEDLISNLDTIEEAEIFIRELEYRMDISSKANQFVVVFPKSIESLINKERE